MRKVSKPTLKKAYLSGMTPKEIAAKYNVSVKYVSDLATKHKWVAERAQIAAKVGELVAESESEAILAMKRQERADMYLLIEGARKQLAAREPTMYRLEAATSVMARAYERLYKSFGIADKVNLNADPDKPMFLKVIW